MILFLGTFLSDRRGSHPVSERIASYLEKANYRTMLVSRFESRVLRLLDYWLSILFRNYSVAVVDVFSDRAFLLAEWAVFWLRMRGKKIVLAMHGGKLSEFGQKHPRRIRNLITKSDFVHTPSLFLKNEFGKQGIEVHYLPNPIDLSQFPHKSPLTRPRDFSILWVRAFSEIYNPKIPIEVIALLVKEFPCVRLTMVGPDGGMLNEVKRLVDQLNLNDYVSFVGAVPNKALYQYYQSHDVYLNTTSYESFGMAVVEAASCGIPIVSHRVGEVPYLWQEGQEILMVETGDIEGMAERVRRVFNDRELANVLSFNARKKAEQFTWNNISSQWTSLVDRLASYQSDDSRTA